MSHKVPQPIGHSWLLLMKVLEMSEGQRPRVVSLIACEVQRVVSRNEELRRVHGVVPGDTLSAFQGLRGAPHHITLAHYLDRIYRYTDCSPSCFVVAFVYLDRLAHRHPRSLTLSINIHRLLLTTLMLAAKLLDDVHYNNAFYARVGGVTNAELNRLEVELLILLDFDVLVTCPVFHHYCLYLESESLFHGQQAPTKHPTPLLHFPADSDDHFEYTTIN